MANEKAAAAKPSAPKGQKKSVVKYFKDARSEFKKVVWPSRKQVINNTVVVLVSMVVSGLAIWGMDTVFMFLIKLMLGK
ncbi:MAG: preprotein translocase subunit SecE [Ruminiclostridium sp.]|nr:preprotein translocase subunit SecE [Ruminiclostridium sp.]MBR4112503.1 preprotein translocase subunit SecE [Ruminiclostridium sp.]